MNRLSVAELKQVLNWIVLLLCGCWIACEIHCRFWVNLLISASLRNFCEILFLGTRGMRLSYPLSPPFPQIDIIRAMMIVWRARGKIIRSVLCSIVTKIVHSELHTHMNRTNSALDWVMSHRAHFTVLRFIFVYVLFCVWLYIACLCSIVTWWGGPGGIEAWSLGPLLPSVLWHCWLGHLTRKTHPQYDL